MQKQKWGDLTIELMGIADSVSDIGDDVDIIRINGKVDGGVYGPEKVWWVGSLEGCDEPQEFVRSKSVWAEGESGIRKLETQGILLKTMPLDESLFIEFSNLYQRQVATRERALKVNLYDQSMAKLKAGWETLVIGAFSENVLLGGLIGYIKREEIHITVGAKELVKGVKGGLGGVLEIKLIQEAFRRKIKKIYHGSSYNPAGIITKAGLWEFKSRYGYTCYPQGEWQTIFVMSESKLLSELLMVGVYGGKLALIALSDGVEEEVKRKYQTKLPVMVLPLGKTIVEMRNALRQK